MITVSVSTLTAQETHRYDINVAAGLLSTIGAKAREVFPKAETIAVVTDETVKALYLNTVEQSLTQQGFRAICFTLPGGESSKNAEHYISLLNWLAENRLTRTDAIVALGGGVVGDLAGFAAASYQRGIAVAQIPTTLLAMVDSSVGGKTAINLAAGKNLAGAFYQPSLVLCDTDVLATLPSGVFSDGCAEVIKYGMIRDRLLLEKIAARPLLNQHDQLAEVIATCVGIKRDIVQNDVFDTGERQLLNFGHT
ncbi:MAG: 3-dehydroquinate synthase, partial [Treponema sp.]|nr:3-dehydroquinate synthase [Treponema sp.]